MRLIDQPLHQLDRQPVEQLGMAGRLALVAEILHGPHQPSPKNAAHWRFIVTRAGSGFSGETSQRARASRLDRDVCGQRGQDREHAGLDTLGGLEVFAAIVDERRPRILRRALAHDQRGVVTRAAACEAARWPHAPWPAQERPSDDTGGVPPTCSGGPFGRGISKSRSISAGVLRATTGRGSVVTEIRNRPSPAA